MMSGITDGLADYAIIKAGLSIIPIFIFLCIAFFSLYYNLIQNYQFRLGNIYTKNIINQSSNNIIFPILNQKLKYNANIKYDIDLPLQKNNDPYINGNVKVYYPLKNSSNYTLYYNPTWIAGIMSCLFCLIFILSIVWLIFLINNKNIAAINGGIELSESVYSAFKR